jgi:hypothetical protein
MNNYCTENDEWQSLLNTLSHELRRYCLLGFRKERYDASS